MEYKVVPLSEYEYSPTMISTGINYGLSDYAKDKSIPLSERMDNINRYYDNERKQIDNDLNKYLTKQYAGAGLQIGSAAIPVGAGLRLGAGAIKALTPQFGKAIATEIGSGLAGGALGGAVEGFGRGLVEGENPFKTSLQDGSIGLITGGALGGAVGRVGQAMAKRNLPNNPAAQQQYFADYVEGLSNNAPLGQISRFDKGLADFRLAREGNVAGGKNNLFDMPITETENFKIWSGDKPLVTSEDALNYNFKTGQGVTLEGFHGTKRGDRVGSEFKKERATSGPMAYFSSDKDIAANYAKGKEDTSFSEEMSDYWQWFKYRDKDGNLKPLGDAYWDLSFDERRALDRNAPHITLDDTAENIVYNPDTTRGLGNYNYALKQYKGNPLKALIDGWLEGGTLYGREDDFLKVLEKTGINMDNINYIDPYTDHSKVYDVYLSMKNPLVTDDLPNKLFENLTAEAPNHPAKYSAYGDIWDKNTQDGVDWVNMLKEDTAKGENSYAWTSIPDWVTDEIKKLGYDGIIDIGGKSGGEIHKVYIPFEPTQIKSVQNQGTFNPNDPNIYKTIAPFATIPLFNLLKQDDK